eukprot:CAMPEP_0194297794 /NCGR_PEP_ID=MMETSP0169-20130528/59803_1 /TAXON_ID=218684 /ORGANISM="Corethron pennatum, Strain L29A3" /LENGTH=1140 /DNA_ID=CAMNT_0039047699 /DNA_START=246 /DNA_END=3668 /DNA_ORIENTATION=+
MSAAKHPDKNVSSENEAENKLLSSKIRKVDKNSLRSDDSLGESPLENVSHVSYLVASGVDPSKAALSDGSIRSSTEKQHKRRNRRKIRLPKVSRIRTRGLYTGGSVDSKSQGNSRTVSAEDESETGSTSGSNRLIDTLSISLVEELSNVLSSKSKASAANHQSKPSVQSGSGKGVGQKEVVSGEVADDSRRKQGSDDDSFYSAHSSSDDNDAEAATPERKIEPPQQLMFPDFSDIIFDETSDVNSGVLPEENVLISVPIIDEGVEISPITKPLETIPEEPFDSSLDGDFNSTLMRSLIRTQSPSRSPPRSPSKKTNVNAVSNTSPWAKIFQKLTLRAEKETGNTARSEIPQDSTLGSFSLASVEDLEIDLSGDDIDTKKKDNGNSSEMSFLVAMGIEINRNLNPFMEDSNISKPSSTTSHDWRKKIRKKLQFSKKLNTLEENSWACAISSKPGSKKEDLEDRGKETSVLIQNLIAIPEEESDDLMEDASLQSDVEDVEDNEAVSQISIPLLEVGKGQSTEFNEDKGSFLQSRKSKVDDIPSDTTSYVKMSGLLKGICFECNKTQGQNSSESQIIRTENIPPDSQTKPFTNQAEKSALVEKIDKTNKLQEDSLDNSGSFNANSNLDDSSEEINFKPVPISYDSLSKLRSPLDNVSNFSLFHAMGLDPQSTHSISSMEVSSQVSTLAATHKKICNQCSKIFYQGEKVLDSKKNKGQFLKKSENDEINVLHTVASSHYSGGKHERALHSYEKAWYMLLEENNRRRIQAIHILNRIGNCHDILGDYDSALEKFRASMSLKRATLGDSTSSEDVIATFQSIGLAHYKNSAFAYEDEFGQALSAYEEVFKEQKKILGLYHIDTAKTLMKIGDCQRRRNQPSKAIESYENALEIYHSINIDGSEEYVIDALRSTAGAFIDQKKNLEALKVYVDVLNIQESSIGEFHVDLARTLCDIGMCYWENNELKKAISSYMRALHINRDVMGDQSREVAENLFSIACVLEEGGELAESLNLFKDTLLIQEIVVGSCNAELVPTIQCVARILENTNRYGRALRAYKEVYRIQKVLSLGEGTDKTVDMARTLCKMGGIYEWKCKHKDAYRAYRKALKIFIKTDISPEDKEFRRALDGYFYEEWVTQWKESHVISSE